VNASELILQDQQLRAEADQLLQRHGISRIVSAYGQLHLSGSYSLHLMTWRDLDAYLQMPVMNVERFLEMGHRLAALMRPRKASFTDHVHFPATEAVVGLYWGFQTDLLSRGGWKIDLWGVTSEVCAERLQHCASIESALTPEARIKILTIKNEVCHHPNYRDTITSQHIYDAVLKGGATSVEEFWKYLIGKDAKQGI